MDAERAIGNPLLEEHGQKWEELKARELEAQRRTLACKALVVGVTALFVIIFVAKAIVLSPASDEKRDFSPSCMHATGGGAVGPRGSLLHFDPRCTEELQEYFGQAYFTEVRRVSDQAIAYFREHMAREDMQQLVAEQGGSGPRSRGTVVFDIDETALSNMDGFFTRSSWARFLGLTVASTACVHPHLELGPAWQPPAGAAAALAALLPSNNDVVGSGLGPNGAAGRRLALCISPPLRATLDLYDFLAANNYTLVFLTGRSEDSRADTEANLQAAGYGRQCRGGSRNAACYADLIMREVGDDRLASVFKAEARGRLVAAGHSLAGNIGDQFSDLVGENSATASFKLPNPVYTLL